MRVLDLNKSSKSSARAQALIFNPLVSKILLKYSAMKKESQADRKQRNLLQAVSLRIKKEKRRLLEEKRRFMEEKEIDTRSSESNYHAYHRKCGHANLKNIVLFERNGKVIASRLPPFFLKELQKGKPDLRSN